MDNIILRWIENNNATGYIKQYGAFTSLEVRSDVLLKIKNPFEDAPSPHLNAKRYLCYQYMIKHGEAHMPVIVLNIEGKLKYIDGRHRVAAIDEYFEPMMMKIMIPEKHAARIKKIIEQAELKE